MQLKDICYGFSKHVAAKFDLLSEFVDIDIPALLMSQVYCVVTTTDTMS